MRIHRATICLAVSCLVQAFQPGTAHSQTSDRPFFPETTAEQAFVLDFETGGVLLEKNADEPFPPASLAKLMTADVVLEALSQREIKNEDTFRVSDYAWRTGGAPSRTATMFAAVRSEVPVDALMRGLIVLTANDAALVLAEGLTGSEDAFVRRMNERSQALGLSGTHYVNATGLPAADQVTTVRDVATLTRHIISDHPNAYKLHRDFEFEWNKIRQRNRNPLLRLDIGATGMATGFDETKGYSIVATAENDGQLTIVALAGLPTEAERTKEARRMLEWAADSFERRILFRKNDVLVAGQVFGGAVDYISGIVDSDIEVYVPKGLPDIVSAHVHYDAPLLAPIEAGSRIGRLTVEIEGRSTVERDVFAAENVPVGAFPARAAGAIRELTLGWTRRL